jgi:hypothetical protein
MSFKDIWKKQELEWIDVTLGKYYLKFEIVHQNFS